MRKHRWYEWLFLSLFVALSVFIIVEGSMNGSSSDSQSKTFAFFFDYGPRQATIVEPTSFTLEGPNELEIHHQATLKPIFTPENTSDTRITYTLEGDSDAITLSGNTITGAKEGNVTIKATSVALPSLSATLDISVIKEKITSLSSSLDTDTSLVLGMTSKMNLESNVTSLSLDDITFVSSDPSIARIDEEGLIRTLRLGSTSLTAYSKEDTSIHTEPITLHVIEGDFRAITSIAPDTNSFYAKDTFSFTPIFNTGASDTRYEVISNDENLNVTNGTILSSSKPGVYSYTLQSINNEDITYTGSIEVKEVKASSITFGETSLQYGKTVLLPYSLVPEVEGKKVTNPKCSFSVSDESIAKADSNGYVMGLKKGAVDIKVTWLEDPSITATVHIAVTSLASADFDQINHLVRKIIGHFSLFLVTGLFGALSLFFFLFKGRERKALYTSLSFTLLLVYGFLLAVLSEIAQIFAGNRGPSWNDVGIDFSGYASAVVIFLIIYLAITFSKAKKKKIENEPKAS